MIKIKVTYNGRSYSSIEDAFKKAAVDGIKEMIEKAIKPFENEIRQANGTVEVKVPSDLKNITVDLKNMPQDLIDRINQALK